MRKYILILGFGIFFTQQIAADTYCKLKTGDKIHCDDCKTIGEFAFYGASAIATAGSKTSIVVTGNNGSKVFVRKQLAWDSYDFSIKAGKYGEFGADIPFPSFSDAQVTAFDITLKLGRYSDRYPYGALKAKCNQIQAEREKAWEKIQQALKDAKDPSTYYGGAIGQHNAAAYTGGWIGTYANRGRRTVVCTTGGTCSYSY